MKPISSVIIFLLLVCSAVWAGFDSYHCAETAIVQDMNQALSKTLAGKREAWITPDTIQSYRQYLQIATLDAVRLCHMRWMKIVIRCAVDR